MITDNYSCIQNGSDFLKQKVLVFDLFPVLQRWGLYAELRFCKLLVSFCSETWTWVLSEAPHAWARAVIVIHWTQENRGIVSSAFQMWQLSSLLPAPHSFRILRIGWGKRCLLPKILEVSTWLCLVKLRKISLVCCCFPAPFTQNWSWIRSLFSTPRNWKSFWEKMQRNTVLLPSLKS